MTGHLKRLGMEKNKLESKEKKYPKIFPTHRKLGKWQKNSENNNVINYFVIYIDFFYFHLKNHLNIFIKHKFFNFSATFTSPQNS